METLTYLALLHHRRFDLDRLKYLRRPGGTERELLNELRLLVLELNKVAQQDVHYWSRGVLNIRQVRRTLSLLTIGSENMQAFNKAAPVGLRLSAYQWAMQNSQAAETVDAGAEPLFIGGTSVANDCLYMRSAASVLHAVQGNVTKPITDRLQARIEGLEIVRRSDWASEVEALGNRCRPLADIIRRGHV